MTIIDLSKPIFDNPEDPGFMRIKIKHKPHWLGRILVRVLGLPLKYSGSFVGWADDTIKKMGVHSTTHIDAPWHYGPEVNGKKALTVDQIPLDDCFADGLVIDVTDIEEYTQITPEMLKERLKKTETVIKPGNIVLIRTGMDKYSGTKEYWKRGVGMSREATLWLIDQGVTIMGIDQWGWDLPFHIQIKKSIASKGSDQFWQGHLVGREKNYWHMEQLVNLGALPDKGFKVGVFPLKIVNASAAPARIIAFLANKNT